MSKKAHKSRFKAVGGKYKGIYQDTKSKQADVYYHRPIIDGKPTIRKLDAFGLIAAWDLKRILDTKQTFAEHGAAKDPYAEPPPTVAVLIAAYKAAGCPRKKGRVRTGKALDQVNYQLAKLEAFWGNRMPNQIKPVHCDEYFDHRREDMREGFHGGRCVDMEIGVLSAVLSWAVKKNKLDANPLAGERDKFRGQDGAEVKHCRDRMPKSAEDLHKLARALFSNPKSEALGWQLLLEAYTGCRTIEVLRLQWTKVERQAGHISSRHLWLDRAKKGVKPWAEIHPDLEALLQALGAWRIWRKLQYNPFFVPSLRKPYAQNPAAVEEQSLAHALKRISVALLGYQVTSHGLRAFYVTVRRSQHVPGGDLQIAAEIGDKTGATMVENTYGAMPDNYYDENAPSMKWAPEQPAWMVLAMPQNVIDIRAAHVVSSAG